MFFPFPGSRLAQPLSSLGLLCATLLIALPTVAQVAPDAGRLLNEYQQAVPATPGSTRPPAILDLPSTTRAPSSSGLRVTLKGIRFSGDTVLADAEDLPRLVQPVVGQTLDHAGLQDLADMLTRYLRGRGYVVARAYLPRQDLTEGVLDIGIAGGRLESGAERIQIKGSTRSSSTRLNAIVASALPEGQVLRAADLERALLLLSDQPGVKARSALERGTQPGTSRLLIDTQATPLVSGEVSVDNYGNRSTGVTRANAQIRANDPLGIGDLLTLVINTSSGADLVGADYSVPLTASGARLHAGASALRYDVDQERFRELDLNGRARTFTLGVSYPLIRSRMQNLWLSADYQHKELQDRGLGQNLRDRQLDNLIVALSGNRFDALAGGGLTEASLALTLGRLDLDGNAADAAVDRAGAKSAGQFTKANVQLSRLQNLGDGSPWALYSGLSAQWASHNLDSAESFLLGGPAGIRAYPVGEASGDAGWLATLELRRMIELGVPGLKLQGLGFLDSGRIWLHEDPWADSINTLSGRNSYALHAFGLGSNLWFEGWSLRTALARTLGDNPGRTPQDRDSDGRASDWRGWVQAGYAF